MRPVHQVADIVILPLEDRFDPAVGEVAYPSGHAVLLGQPPAGVAEQDTLDPAGDQHPIAKHMQTVRRDGAFRPGGARAKTAAWRWNHGSFGKNENFAWGAVEHGRPAGAEACPMGPLCPG